MTLLTLRSDETVSDLSCIVLLAFRGAPSYLHHLDRLCGAVKLAKVVG